MTILTRTLLLSLFSVWAVTAYAETPPPAITVSGEASVSVAPDRAEIDGGVTTEAKTAREAGDANAKAMTAVFAALKSAGIADADIQTSRLSLQPQISAQKPGGPTQITGYQASNRVTVRLRDAAKVASTIDALTGAGANDIGGIRFIVSQESKLLDEARVQALADARRKAEIYAKAANVRIGAPLSIAEDGANSPPMPMRAAYRAAAATPVSPGEETLRVTVTVAYEIKPATP
ncbi:MAG: SIMPL domain-containing protein [Xanthobacteraceae bacterium]